MFLAWTDLYVIDLYSPTKAMRIEKDLEHVIKKMETSLRSTVHDWIG